MRSSRPEVTEFDRVKERPGGRNARVRQAVVGAVLRILQEQGYGSLSHRSVAALAGVDSATVYRRWPTRPRLVADMLIDLSDTFVPVPNTGSIERDFLTYLESITAMLDDPGMTKLTQALFVASIEGDEAVSDVLGEFWRGRFSRSYVMLERAVQRGELPPLLDQDAVVEALVAPAWFRAFVSRLPNNEAFRRRCVGNALVMARNELCVSEFRRVPGEVDC
ncbi:TetR/AcrR family transcriptional regulator [Rhizobiaceae bacterium CRRU44]|uniref:TetR/AcrR family transcriptional regulator n=2 Tax=Hyphomicrobiales TaxID=356 RepID=A0AA43ZHT8_9HYPH|nr:TetR/AcrR family transcriptional regulator [Ferranicluibacter rubi]TCQ20094.1 TetR family transcriptional regulator [Rhizobium sp. PP-CC-3G-465]